QVSWHDAEAFCRWLSRVEGRTYRLPTEAEWYWACRAGDTAPLSAVWVDAMAVYAAEGKPIPAQPQPVGRQLPNAWGLFDTYGNVAEWGRDTITPIPGSPLPPPPPGRVVDPVLTGGSHAIFL